MIIFILFILIVLLYYYNVRKFDYWKKKGIKYEVPWLFFGTNKTLYLKQQCRSKMIEEMYWKYPNEKVVGGFKFTEPELVVRDPELIKKVLISDFSSFYIRGLNANKKYFEPLRKHVFMIEGDMWRMLRVHISPAFTTSKLKAMFPLILETTAVLQVQALTAAEEKRPIDARNLMACYTTDSIGACGFGVDSNSLSNRNSAFRKIGSEVFNLTFKDLIVGVLKEIFPEMCKKLKNGSRFEKKIFDIVQQIKSDRNFKPSGRNDFIDLLLEYQAKGKMEAVSIEKTNPDGSPVIVSAELDDECFAAQVFMFFVAGFETSSSTSSFTLHQLAYHPEVQKKVQEDIDRALEKHNNVLSYDSIKDMTYLTWAFQEAYRMFPVIGYLIRKSAKKYTFTDINLTIDEGTLIYISVQGLHMDPKYWDKPEEYRPERFDPANFTPKQKSVYMLFGAGPRNCIGSRLGLMQSIAGLAAILSKFSVEPAPESIQHFDVEPTSNLVQTVKGNKLPLIFKKRQLA